MGMLIQPGLQDKLGGELVLHFPKFACADADFIKQQLFGFECRQGLILLKNR